MHEPEGSGTGVEMEYLTAELILAYVAMLGCIGGGIRFLLVRMDAERTKIEAERVRHELKIDTERLKHESLVADQIAEMRRELAAQEREIVGLRRTADAYIRHVAILHHLMREAGIAIPALVLPEAVIVDAPAKG